MNYETLIAGESHVTALGIPLKSDDGTHEVMPIQQHPSLAGLVGTWPRQFDDYWAAAAQHSAGKSLALVTGGNQHLAHFLFAPEPLFDLVSSELPDLELIEGAEILPEAVFRAYFEPTFGHVRPYFGKLRDSAARLFICGTPPPKEDDQYIRERFHYEPFFGRVAEAAGQDVKQMPLSPPVLRLKLWLVLQAVLRDMAEKEGATFIPVPDRAKTPEGFLKPEYYSVDITHANTAYGELMLQEIEKASETAVVA